MRATSVVRAAAALIVLVAPAIARAQMLDLLPGVRVRFTAPGLVAGRFEGTVIGRTGDSLTVATSDGLPLRVPLGAIAAMDVSAGRTTGQGALTGAKWGLAVGGGLSLFALFLSDCPDCSDGGRVALALFGTAVYTGVGALIGAAVGGEEWKPYTLPPRVGLVTSPRGTGVGLRVGF